MHSVLVPSTVPGTRGLVRAQLGIISNDAVGSLSKLFEAQEIVLVLRCTSRKHQLLCMYLRSSTVMEVRKERLL